MSIYSKWIEGTPHTNRYAKPNKFRDVKNKRAIELRNASFRNATFDGIFELECQCISVDPIIGLPSGKAKVKVICSWYGCTSDTTYPKIDITNAEYCKIIDCYSGDVVDNIGN